MDKVTDTENIPSVQSDTQWGGLSIEDIRKHFAPTATDKEFAMFLATANTYGLSPVKREIHFIKFGGRAASVIGYETYLKRAERTGALDGWNCELIVAPEVRARITIWRKDKAHPIEWDVWLAEVNSGNGLWKTMPRFMLRKVAIAQGMRLAFPDELGGMPYIPEEIPSGGTIDGDVVRLHTTATKITKEDIFGKLDALEDPLSDDPPEDHHEDIPDEELTPCNTSGETVQDIIARISDKVKMRPAEQKPEPTATSFDDVEEAIRYIIDREGGEREDIIYEASKFTTKTGEIAAARSLDLLQKNPRWYNVVRVKIRDRARKLSLES